MPAKWVVLFAWAIRWVWEGEAPPGPSVIPTPKIRWVLPCSGAEAPWEGIALIGGSSSSPFEAGEAGSFSKGYKLVLVTNFKL